MTTKPELQKWKASKQGTHKRDDLLAEFMMPFDRMFDEIIKANFPAMQSKYGGDFFEKGSYPKVDIFETKDALVIEAAVPGMTRDEITVDVHDGILMISGEKRSGDSNNEGNYIYRELKRSTFRRSWTLAENLDPNKISAKLENGMLYLSIGKIQIEEMPKPRQIKIN